MKIFKFITWKILFFAIIPLFALAAGYGLYKYALLERKFAETQELLTYTTTVYGEKIDALEESLSDSRQENVFLLETLNAERAKNSVFEKQIGGIASIVGTLDKLSKVDPELLQKYSKVYFLNEHFVPEKLAVIPSKYLLNPERVYELHAGILPYLDKLFQAAEADGVDLKVISAYRSFSDQSSLKAAYKVTYGTGTANQFSADQGYSEHQLGTTVDFTTKATGSSLDSFKTTAAYEWLKKHAHEYGFVLSYPENNAFYVFEPWHWRFVGIKLATRLYQDQKYFYDLDQREIDKYLVSFFD